MNLSGLEPLGKIAGIGGIAVGGAVLLLNESIGTIPGLPLEEQAGVVKLIAVLGFCIGVLGIIAWIASRWPATANASTTGSESPAINARGDATVSYGASESERPNHPIRRQKTTEPLSGTARTIGDRSPAILSGGDASVRYKEGTPAKPKAKRKERP